MAKKLEQEFPRPDTESACGRKAPDGAAFPLSTCFWDAGRRDQQCARPLWSSREPFVGSFGI